MLQGVSAARITVMTGINLLILTVDGKRFGAVNGGQAYSMQA